MAHLYIVSCPGYGKTVSELENGHLEIVDFPIKHGGSSHCLCKRLPEGNRRLTLGF